MKFDTSRNARELRQLADLGLSVAIGCLAGDAFGLPLWVAVSAALVVIRPWKQKPEGSLWKKPTVRLAVLTLCLLGLLSNWPAYRDGVFAGYSAAQSVAER